MNKMQVRTALETMCSIKDELIEERKKVAEDLAYIEEQIEAIMTLIPVFMKRKDSDLEVKITVPPAHLDIIMKEANEFVKDEVAPLKRWQQKGKERIFSEREKALKHEWYLRNKDKLDAKRKQRQAESKKALAPEVFDKQFEAAVQTEKPLPIHILEKHEPKLNYFGEGD